MEIDLQKTDIRFVPGIGPKKAVLFKKQGIETVEQLLEYLPLRYVDRSTTTPLNAIHEDEEYTVLVDVIDSRIVSGGKKRLIITVTDNKGLMTVVFFNRPAIFKDIFKPGRKVALSGKVSYYRGYQMVHPDFEFVNEKSDSGIHTGRIIPMYRVPEVWRKSGISSHSLRRIIFAALQKYASQVRDVIPDHIRREEKLLDRKTAIRALHFPDSFELFQKALTYIKWEELFYLFILMGLRKLKYQMPKTGISFAGSTALVKKLIEELPFELTGAQKRVIKEIYEDMRKDIPMHRMIQGDVGSGKTIVALIAMLVARESGYQTALMVPTEILAEQHYFNYRTLLKPYGIEPILLKGAQSAKIRKTVLNSLAQDRQAIVIGTHALFQKEVEFANLGLVVIDEQHRFGVMQRAQLVNKGKVPDILVMTATPIPRTLAFTLFGDLDHSRIDEMPPGRQQIVTAWRTNDRLPKVLDFVEEKIKEGQQAYIVLPLIEESEKIDVRAAQKMYEDLQKSRFAKYSVALLHGRMKANEKENIMNEFKNGNIDVLVSTTVIEVGIDVPNATIMLIIDAHRFGLSQLHQLRGRVGRGKLKSYCVLITPAGISENGKNRMEIMEKTTDGFQLAEEDLRLRGTGEFTGIKQHGANELKFVDLINDYALVEHVKNRVTELLTKDPQIRLQTNVAVREKITKEFNEKLLYIKSF